MPTPARVDLTTERHPPRNTYFGLIARTQEFVNGPEKYEGGWSPVESDSLQARVWGGFMSSVTLFMRRQPDNELRGVARYFTDGMVVDSTGRWMWETYPTATASLHPVPCDADKKRQGAP